MSITYTPATNFTAKDSMSASNPDKVLSGVPFDFEFSAISTAFAQAAPTSAPTFTGTATFDVAAAVTTLTATTVNGSTTTTWDTAAATVTAKEAGWDATKATVDANSTSWIDTKNTVNAGSANWDTAYGWGDHSQAGYISSFTDTTYTAGSGLDLTGTVFSHEDTSSVANSNNSGNTFIQDLTFDSFGHVTGVTTGTATDTLPVGGTNINVSGSTVNLDSSLVITSAVASGGVSASSFTTGGHVETDEIRLGNWVIKLDGNDLRFVYNGTDRIRMTTTGAIIAENDITAFGSA